MLIGREPWRYSGRTPEFFTGQAGCFCCPPPPPPEAAAYYYYQRGGVQCCGTENVPTRLVVTLSSTCSAINGLTLNVYYKQSDTASGFKYCLFQSDVDYGSYLPTGCAGPGLSYPPVAPPAISSTGWKALTGCGTNAVAAAHVVTSYNLSSGVILCDIQVGFVRGVNLGPPFGWSCDRKLLRNSSTPVTACNPYLSSGTLASGDTTMTGACSACTFGTPYDASATVTE